MSEEKEKWKIPPLKVARVIDLAKESIQAIENVIEFELHKEKLKSRVLQ